MFFKAITYLKFLVKSTNQHGVHSPFVFNYVTQCLYKKPRKSKIKTLDIVLKSSAYFNFNTIKLIGNTSFKKILENQLSSVNFEAKNIEILYFNTPRMINQKELFSEFKIKNNCLIIVDNIYNTKEEYASWAKLIESEKITVSIDMYYCGVLSIRKEQEKEHFTIRI